MKNFRVTLLDGFEDVIVAVEVAAVDVYDLVAKLRKNELTAEYCYSNEELVNWHFSGDVNIEELGYSDIIVSWENDGKMYVDLNELVTFEIEEI